MYGIEQIKGGNAVKPRNSQLLFGLNGESLKTSFSFLSELSHYNPNERWLNLNVCRFTNIYLNMQTTDTAVKPQIRRMQLSQPIRGDIVNLIIY